MQAAGGADEVATRRPTALLFAVAGVTVALDQITKAVAVARLDAGGSFVVIDGVLHWTLKRNPGAAFSLFTSVPWLFTILATLISIWIVAQARRVSTKATAFALGMVLGGALGNLIDRVARSPGIFRGHVIDFIDLQVWPVFNVADMGVSIGAVLLVIASVIEERKKRE